MLFQPVVDAISIAVGDFLPMLYAASVDVINLKKLKLMFSTACTLGPTIAIENHLFEYAFLLPLLNDAFNTSSTIFRQNLVDSASGTEILCQ